MIGEDTELLSWAFDHGWRFGTCADHGPFWSDSPFQCPTCEREESK